MLFDVVHQESVDHLLHAHHAAAGVLAVRGPGFGGQRPQRAEAVGQAGADAGSDGADRVVAMLVDGADALGIIVGPPKGNARAASDALGLMRPVRQQLRDVRERAHHWPLTGARLAIEHVGGKSLDLLEEALHARLQTLGAFFGRHPDQCSRPLGTSRSHCLH